MGDIVPLQTELTTAIGEAAVQLAAYGFYVFPVYEIDDTGRCSCGAINCGHPGKHPRVKSGLKEATVDVDKIRRWWIKWPNANIGVNCELSGVLVVDIDPRNGGNEYLAKLEAENADLPPTYEIDTGSGGKHYYFRVKFPVKSKPIAPGVDIKSKGGYVIAPPSTHVSGGVYSHVTLGDPSTLVLPVPPWIISLCTRAEETNKVAGNLPVESGLMGAGFLAAGWLGDYLGPGKRAARCPFDSEHTTGTPGVADSSTVIYAPEGGGKQGFAHCSHSHCANRTQADYWNALPESARKLAKANVGVGVFDDVVTEDDWQSALVRDSKGKITKSVGNAILILRNAPEFVGCLGYDQFKGAHVWLKALPPVPGMDPILPGPVEDKHLLQIAFLLFSKYDCREFAGSTLFEMLAPSAIEFHPVRDYLNGLVWDGKPRVVDWLHTYLGAESTQYTRSIGTWWLCSAVKRVMQPGCLDAQHVLILEGPQGTRKSTALRVLGGQWFADTPLQLDSKDAYMGLRGKWIYELQELQSLSRADSDRAKSFFSSPEDSFRAPYGRLTISIPRQCVFAGTVNYELYLKDPSGERRYWPCATGVIDIDALERDRDQLWAEAYQMYLLGQKICPTTQDEHDMCKDEQIKRQVLDEDPWADMISTAIHGKDEIRVNEVISILPNAKHDTRDAMRVARCLKTIGFEKKRKGHGGPTIWVRKIQNLS